MFGYTNGEIVNQSIERLIPQSVHGVFGCHRDGTVFRIDVFLTPEEHSAALTRILIVRDAERTESEDTFIRAALAS
jgi:hypothetical protein